MISDDKLLPPNFGGSAGNQLLALNPPFMGS